jgi:nucleoside-diphosphate-sugar epimerase
MKLFLTGATGATGPATLRELVGAGHDVRAVARSETKTAAVRAAGGDPVAVDLFDGDAVKAAVAGCDGVLHLATHVPPIRKMARRKAWDEHNRLRTTATALLVDAALSGGAGVFVKESVTFVYPDCGDRWIDETTPPDDSIEMLRPTMEGERLVERITAEGGRSVVLRFGLFYGPDSRGTDEALRLARLRMSTIAGRPNGYMSSIHTDDVATSVVDALDAPSGVYNVCDDEPLTRREYLDAFSDAFGLRRLRPVPAPVVKMVAGSAAAAITSSQRVSNRKLREAAGWQPKYPSAREGWRQIAAARRA